MWSTLPYYLFFILLLSATTQAFAQYKDTTCYIPSRGLCSYSSAEVLLLPKMKQYCLRQKGLFNTEKKCPKKKYLSRVCKSTEYKFSVLYEKSHFTQASAKSHCSHLSIPFLHLRWTESH